MASFRLMLVCALLLLALVHVQAAKVYLLDDGVEDQDAVETSISTHSTALQTSGDRAVADDGRSNHRTASYEDSEFTTVNSPNTSSIPGLVNKNIVSDISAEYASDVVNHHPVTKYDTQSSYRNADDAIDMSSSSHPTNRGNNSDVGNVNQEEAEFNKNTYISAEHKTKSESVSENDDNYHDNTRQGSRAIRTNGNYEVSPSLISDKATITETRRRFNQQIQGNVKITNSKRGPMNHQYVPIQDKYNSEFVNFYKRQTNPQSNAYEILRGPSPPNEIYGSAYTQDPFQRLPIKDSYESLNSLHNLTYSSLRQRDESHNQKPSDSLGSATISHSSQQNGFFQPPNTSYNPKPTDFYVSSDASYKPQSRGPFRPQQEHYSSPQRKAPSVTHGLPHYKPPGNAPLPRRPPARKPLTPTNGTPLRKPQGSPPFYKSPHNSPTRKPSGVPHGTPSRNPPTSLYGTSPHKPSSGSLPSKPYDSYGSHSTLHNLHHSSPHLSTRPSFESPQKNQHDPSSFNSQFNEPYNFQTPLHNSSPQGSRSPVTFDSSVLDDTPRPSYDSPSRKPQSSSFDSQSDYLHGSPTSSYNPSSHGIRSPTKSSNRGPNPSYDSPSRKPGIPTYESQSDNFYESPTPSHSSRQPIPVRLSSHVSSSSDSAESPTSVYGSSYSDSHKSLTPSHGSTTSLLYDDPSDKFHESLSSSGKGTSGPTYTFVKTDYDGNVKWGVRHSVGSQYAGGHQ
ncbi:uncharacterized protein DKFZp434B061-like isoform X2 [Periplaneta americana]|uniref:uncharacterized protein DKFZp434B061-like isoform X2 n=1 Tax=Periplaneta americana TaxID=6978 RepID=UPI0037E9C6AD